VGLGVSSRLEDATLGEGGLDAAVMFDVIEHLRDPFRTLDRASSSHPRSSERVRPAGRRKAPDPSGGTLRPTYLELDLIR
jgi:hypothetical protein